MPDRTCVCSPFSTVARLDRGVSVRFSSPPTRAEGPVAAVAFCGNDIVVDADVTIPSDVTDIPDLCRWTRLLKQHQRIKETAMSGHVDRRNKENIRLACDRSRLLTVTPDRESERPDTPVQDGRGVRERIATETRCEHNRKSPMRKITTITRSR